MSDRTDPLQMERATLSSGLEVVLQPSPASARSFSITYVAPAGWGFEPPEARGLAMVTAKLCIGMPGGRSREELARILDRLGASLTCSVASESAEFTLWGPEEAWEPLVGIFSDAVFRPHFASEELARTVRQLKERQLRQWVQPEQRADKQLLAALFPSTHPYHFTGLGDARSAARISVGRVRRFHQGHYPTRSAVLAVTSRASRARLIRSLEHQFPSSEVGPEPSLPPVEARIARAQRVDVPIRGQSQVAIRIGAPSIARSDPSYPALYLVNEVLGGRPLLSRLFQRIREQHGLAYHASSNVEAMRWGGYWEAVAGTDPSTRDRVVQLIEEEVERLSTDLIPGRELDRIRESAVDSLPLELETTASAHELAIDVAYHRLSGDFYRLWPGQLRRYSPKELRAAAETGFRPDRAVVVTAGPPPK